MKPLRLRLRPFSNALDLAPLRDCIVDYWSLERDMTVMSGGRLDDRLYVLADGFAFDFSTLTGGKRHIFDFYGPGAICNWSRPAREDKPEHLLFKARSEVLVLDRHRVTELLAGDSAIAHAIVAHELRRSMRVSQRVRALISLPAKECLRTLLLDIEDEYSTSGEPRMWVPLSLTQEEIGDLIGSTSVHVSRTIASMEKDHELERRTTSFHIHGIEQLRERMAYRRFFDALPELRTAVNS